MDRKNNLEKRITSYEEKAGQFLRLFSTKPSPHLSLKECHKFESFLGDVHSFVSKNKEILMQEAQEGCSGVKEGINAIRDLAHDLKDSKQNLENMLTNPEYAEDGFLQNTYHALEQIHRDLKQHK